jgi:hypothetical protein
MFHLENFQQTDLGLNGKTITYLTDLFKYIWEGTSRKYSKIINYDIYLPVYVNFIL